MKDEKPKGWANLQQQLKEVREESFKQGVWQGKSLRDNEILEIIKELKKKMFNAHDCSRNDCKCYNSKQKESNAFIVFIEDWKEFTSKIKGKEKGE